MDRGAWQATVHGVTESWTRLSAHVRSHTHTHTHTQTIDKGWMNMESQGCSSSLGLITPYNPRPYTLYPRDEGEGEGVAAAPREEERESCRGGHWQGQELQ